MKTLYLRGLLVLLALVGPAFSARALNPALFNDGFAPLTPALTQFFLDLEAIPAGSIVTDAQHATLVADLSALPPGPAAPTAADLDELATNFGAAAVAGLVDDALEYRLAMDFDVDADDPDSWLAYVQNDVLFALHPPAPYDPNAPGVDPGLVYGTAVSAVVPVRKPGVVVTRDLIPLKAVYDTVASQSPIIYDGSVRMTTRTQADGVAVPTLSFSASGLPADGTYTLSVVRRSDRATVVIGTFLAQPFVAQPVGGATLTFGHVARTYLNTDVQLSFGAGTAQPLPDGFDAADVKTLLVTNAEGRTRLKQKLSTTGTAAFQARVAYLHLYNPTSGAPGGRATTGYKLNAHGTTPRNQLHLKARHLPANAPVTLLVDGVKVDTYTTTAMGSLLIAQRSTSEGSVHPYTTSNLNPLLANVDLLNAKSVSLVDAAGNVLLSGSL